MDSDFFLIRKMRQGDEDAFDAFIRKYYGDILRYCACHCFDAEDAQDLTQETFMRFFSRFSDYRHKGKTKNYLYTIISRIFRNIFSLCWADMPGVFLSCLWQCWYPQRQDLLCLQ